MALIRVSWAILGRGGPSGVGGSGVDGVLLLLHYTSGIEYLGQEEHEPKRRH